jgi:copper chaperone CopZ
MKRATFALPSMYADHHLVAVKKSLSELEGVEEVEASSAFREVKVSPSAIEARLKEAGYPPGEEKPLEFQSRSGDPVWRSSLRSIKTHPADLDMSGEFRRY